MPQIPISVSKEIAPGDRMYSGNEKHYFDTGAGALRIIQHALDVDARRSEPPRRILDYACGYGRVLRWIRAAHPEAEIVAADTDENAVAAVSSLFGVKSLVLDRSLTEPLGTFDLIWVGSLMTHLPKTSMQRHLRRFYDLLEPGGLLVFTTHGPLIANRIRTGERTYDLNEGVIAQFLSDYDEQGYGFGPYPKQESYGISACTPSVALQLVEHACLEPVCYQSRAWDRHQDAITARHVSVSRP